MTKILHTKRHPSRARYIYAKNTQHIILRFSTTCRLPFLFEKLGCKRCFYWNLMFYNEKQNKDNEPTSFPTNFLKEKILSQERQRKKPILNTVKKKNKQTSDPTRQSCKKLAFQGFFLFIRNWLPDCLDCPVLQNHGFYNEKNLKTIRHESFNQPHLFNVRICVKTSPGIPQESAALKITETDQKHRSRTNWKTFTPLFLFEPYVLQ